MNRKITLILFLLVLSTTVFAQSNLEAAQQTNLLDLIKTGGWAMWPLGAFSVFMVTLIIQNYISLRAKKLLHVDQMPKLLDLMINRKVTSALIYCKENPSLFSNTYSAGLEKYLDDNEIDFQKVKSAVEEASVEQTAKLMKPIDYLSIIGATSPMLGLLGTVSGMIKAFKTMGTSGMGKPELLAANIGEALITTATGLIIAIPAMFFFFYFKKSFQKSLATIGRNIGFLFDALQSGKKPTSFLNLEDLKKLEQK
jgi:biopolymer transport protein ExbB